MVESVIGLQQIITTIAFLAVMIGVLIFMRVKGKGLRRSLHHGKRIEIIEETGISPVEKMRLIKIDDKEFIVISAKGVQPVITPLGSARQVEPAAPAMPATSAVATQPEPQQTPLVLGEENTVSSSAFQRALEKAATQSDNSGELSAFSQKFKSWRMS